MAKTKMVHIISGTHWDREWRYTADQSLLRLAELMDELLEVLEKRDDYACFLLDGGTVVIEDYLIVRPENAERLRNLVQQGKIANVKWYTLPEMSSVSPEALVRNLLMGKRLGDEYGGTISAGYTATSNGQISQLPQIYRGFGIKNALSYRGTNKHEVPPICLWESPDGSRIHHIRGFDEVTRTNWFFFVHYELVLGRNPRDLKSRWVADDWPVHMADTDMYQTAFQLKNEKFDFKTDEQEIKSAMRHFLDQAGPQAIGDNLLALDMEDNACPYSRLPNLIATINASQDECILKHTSLDEYMDTVIKATENEQLHVHKGEMRYTAIEVGFNGLLGLIYSSHIMLKIMNDQAERELINIAEPLSSFSAMLGGSYEKNLFHRGWLELLKNHAHDSMSGAAIAEAHLDNPTRFRATRAIARECCRKAIEEIWCKLDTETCFKEGDLTITFFNTLTTAKKTVASIVLDVPDIATGAGMVERCSGAGPIIEGFDPEKVVNYNHFDIIDEAGNNISYEIQEKENVNMEVERVLDSNAAAYKVIRNRILMEVDVPPFGYRTYALRPRVRKYITEPKPGANRALISQADGILENEFLKVVINSNGTFDLTDKKTGKVIKGMHYFCDNGCISSAHLNIPLLRDYTITSLGNAAVLSLVENNTLRASWRVELSMSIPAGADLDERNRSDKMIPLPITSWLTLGRGSKRLEIKTRIENSARDHRLRIMLPSDIQTDEVCAEGAFDVIKHKIQWNQTAENMEAHYPTKPMNNFVSLTDGNNGLAFFSKGLREYEVIDDPRRTLAITLLRTHRSYMLATVGLLTPEEYEAQEGHHCIGTTEIEYAIYPHQGNWRSEGVALEALDFKINPRAIQGVPKAGDLPPTNSFMSLIPVEHVHFSALYQNENGSGYILRLWNSLDKSVEATIKSVLNFKSITKISMDEERKENTLEKAKNGWLLPLRKAEIATLLIETH